ncbi:MAG: ArsR family transcriptional regulator [Candidatus Thermoplasmatota archaeon]|nr:ArsR family transcriptional regulator [Candidatus Thermoplasmatota archaeon]MDI6856267.1 ArsR family transcriptional regulator [Candidatus Thermoplasmatota archaeon]
MRKKLLLDRNDKKIVKLLTTIGIAKNLAKVLVFFFKVNETVSAQVERALSLRQPEVSVALKMLEQKGFVAKTNIKKGCKGRPMYAYRLVQSPQKITKKLEKCKLRELKKVTKNLELLRKLVATHFSAK